MKKILYKLAIVLFIAVLFFNMSSNTVYAIAEIRKKEIYLHNTEQVRMQDKIVTKLKYKGEYIESKTTGYYSKNGFTPAYCINENLAGVEKGSYYINVDNILENDKIYRVIKNGYPNKSPEQMGLERDTDAFAVTQFAVYCVLGQLKLENFTAEKDDKVALAMLKALKNLVYIGINGKAKQEKNPVSFEKVGELKLEGKYYTQEYKLVTKEKINTYEIQSESIIPEGCYIAGENGTKKKLFENPKENFKIVIPEELIKKDLDFNIKIAINCEIFMVLEGKSLEKGRQNFAIGINGSQYLDENIKLNLRANKSSIKINKIEEESKNPIEGVKFGLYDENNKLIETKRTDRNGIIKFANLYEGKYTIIEEQTTSKYILNEKPINIELQYDEQKDITVTNKLKTGSLKIAKVDKENKNIKIEGVKFELYNEESKKIGTYITDKDGEILIQNLPIGDYKIKEIETNKWYKIEKKEKNLEIKQDRTTDLEITNELKKGQIKIIKIDKDSNNKLSGVKFEVQDKEGKVLETITTDNNGEAVTSEYSLKKYEYLYLKEIKTKEGYVLNNEKIKIKLEEEKIKTITIENEKIKGRIEIYKTSKNDNKMNGKKAGSPLQGVKFEIYDAKNNLIEKLTTDKAGIAISSNLEKGEYIIKEIDAGKYYYKKEEPIKINISKNQEIVSISIQNESINPDIDIEKSGPSKAKIGEEIEYDISIRNTGNTSLDNFTMVDTIPAKYIDITKIKTGTYNQNVTYDLYYKSNLTKEYVLFMEDLSTKENYEIDFKEELAKDEYIKEIKMEFGTVDSGFCSSENPNIFGKIRKSAKSEDKFTNIANISGMYDGYKINDNSKVTTQVIKILPRTGI